MATDVFIKNEVARNSFERSLVSCQRRGIRIYEFLEIRASGG